MPVIVLGGTGPMDASRRRSGIDWVHTALVQGNQVRDYVKWDDQPHSLSSVPLSFIRAYRIATTEPAPVYICYDAALQEDPIDAKIEIPDISRFSPAEPVPANPEALRRAARLLVGAQSPLIIADYFGRHPQAVASLIELAELLAIPVIDKGNRFNFPNTHPFDITGGAKEYLQKADVVLALDVHDLYGSLTTSNITTRVCEYVTRPGAKIIHISLKDMLIRSWAEDYQHLRAVDIPISADTTLAVPELARLCREIIANDKMTLKGINARAKVLNVGHRERRAKWTRDARLRITGKISPWPFWPRR